MVKCEKVFPLVQNAPTCYFTELSLEGDELALGDERASTPLPTLSALEQTILDRQYVAQRGSCFLLREMLC